MIQLYTPIRVGSSLRGSWGTSRNRTQIVCLVLDAGNVRNRSCGGHAATVLFNDNFPQVRG